MTIGPEESDVQNETETLRDLRARRPAWKGGGPKAAASPVDRSTVQGRNVREYICRIIKEIFRAGEAVRSDGG